MNNLRGRMAAGAVWMVGFKLLDRSIGLISTLILARLLVPQDFGVVAMAMSFVALLELATAFGFDVALIQKQTRDRGHWDTAWTFNVLLGLSVAIAMVAGAAYVADFYRQVELEHVIRALAIGSVVQGFENIGIVAFRTEMRFDREFRFLISKKLIAFSVTIPAALILDSYWALVIGQVTSRTAGVALSYLWHPYRPRLALVAARDLMHLSKWLLASNISEYLRERSSDWIIGRLSGARALGVYNIGAELAALPGTELVAPINRAVLPAYAKISTDNAQLKREYLSVVATVALLGLPAAAGIGAVAGPLVALILGGKWLDTIPVIQILAIASVVRVLSGNAFPVYLARSRADIIVRLNFMYGVLNVLLMWPLTARFGLVGAAAGSLAATVIGAPVSLGIAMRMIGVRVAEMARAIWRPCAAAALMFIVLTVRTGVHDPALGPLHSLTSLAAAVALGALLYVVGLIAAWALAGRPEGAETMLWRRARMLIRNLRLP